ncbi:MAG: 6-phosphofructokinase [Bacteroidetes bacterium]|nr:6-phosphofructokinase [Bacteroidota bacterium]
MRKIALITSGGDAPGMNACVRAVVKTAKSHNIEVIGIEDGYQGMIEGRGREMTYNDVNNIIQLGGTILGTARSEEFRTPEGRQKAIANLKKWQVDGLVVIGGDGSFAGAQTLSREIDLPIIGVPGTIDNDIFGTDHTIGYDTALNTVVSAVDKIRDTASSHHRIFFVEVMGRDAGFIALNSGIASGADDVLIPEEWTDIDALVNTIKESSKGRRSSIIIVSEGDDAGGAKEIMTKVKPFLDGYDLRCSILGHIQRGGSPSVLDRILATRMGYEAVNCLIRGESGYMIGAKGEEMVKISLERSIKEHAKPTPDKLEMMHRLKTR